MDKAIWTVCTAKLCPKCIKEMEAEYIVYLTHEQQRNRMKDIAILSTIVSLQVRSRTARITQSGSWQFMYAEVCSI